MSQALPLSPSIQQPSLCNHETQQLNQPATQAQDSEQGLCRLCLQDDSISQLLSCCGCTGSVRYIHPRCLGQWQQMLWLQGQFHRALQCDVCCQPYQPPLQFNPYQQRSLWQTIKQHWLQLQYSPERAFWAWRCCILLGGLAAGTHHGVAGFGAGLSLGLRLARPTASWTVRLMPQLGIVAAILPSLAPALRAAVRCSCGLMLLEIVVAAAVGLFGGGVMGFCLGTVGVLKLSATVGCQVAAAAAKVATGVSKVAWPRAVALLLLKSGRRLLGQHTSALL